MSSDVAFPLARTFRKRDFTGVVSNSVRFELLQSLYLLICKVLQGDLDSVESGDFGVEVNVVPSPCTWAVGDI